MSFRELINGFIGRFGELVGVKFDPLDEDGYASMRRGSAVIGLNVIEDRGVLILLAPTMRVPEQEQATFFRRLLELNLVATGDAAFAVDSQRSIVCLRALRGLPVGLVGLGVGATFHFVGVGSRDDATGLQRSGVCADRASAGCVALSDKLDREARATTGEGFSLGALTAPIGGFVARQIWAFSLYDGFDYASEQGGTGIAGAGNCAGTVFPTNFPAGVVATVAVVNTTATGYLRAWNGGTTLTVGGILGWNAGDVLSNTTVIPLNRNIDPYPDSGALKRDFAVYNNSGSPVDVIVDVVGYFVRNQATALACTRVSDSRVHGLAPGASIELLPPACPPDWTPIVALPRNHEYGVDVGMVSETTCRFANYTTAIQDVSCDMQCCRVPGR